MIPKFRVAFKNNILGEVGSIDFVDETVTIPVYDKVDGEYLGDNVWGLNQVTLMQSTGLFDNSTPKKEIFEGDVLRDSESIVIVKFVDGAFSVDYRNMGGEWKNYGSLFRYLRDFEGEIIGNVYENPELVEAQNDTEV